MGLLIWVDGEGAIAGQRMIEGFAWSVDVFFNLDPGAAGVDAGRHRF
jgi:hypothetical protein